MPFSLGSYCRLRFGFLKLWLRRSGLPSDLSCSKMMMVPGPEGEGEQEREGRGREESKRESCSPHLRGCCALQVSGGEQSEELSSCVSRLALRGLYVYVSESLCRSLGESPEGESLGLGSLSATVDWAHRRQTRTRRFRKGLGHFRVSERCDLRRRSHDLRLQCQLLCPGPWIYPLSPRLETSEVALRVSLG